MADSETGLDLSIVIPAFNEGQRLPSAIALLAEFLDQTPVRAEVIVVENGSTDDTADVALRATQADSRFRLFRVPQAGKGRAVRHGMQQAGGSVLAFCDADFSMPVEQIRGLQCAVARGADIAIASREAAGAHRIGEPWCRHFMGRVFNLLVQAIAVRGLSDTQCGFKAFRREVARDLFGRQRLNGWAFDVEVLFLAQRSGYRIEEVPITWRYDPSSRVRPVRDTIAMLRELLTIRWNAASGRYR